MIYIMNYNIKEYSIFPTCVYYISNFLTNQQCLDIIQFARFKTYTSHGALIGEAVSNHGNNDIILNEISKAVSSCENIIEKLNSVLSSYVSKIGYMPVKLTNSWINIQKKGSSLLPHKHPGNSVSGVMYLAVDEASSPLVFSNPNPFISYSSRKGNTDFNAEFSALSPLLGSCVLFPSWLSHSSGKFVNYSEERIALSFNADI